MIVGSNDSDGIDVGVALGGFDGGFEGVVVGAIEADGLILGTTVGETDCEGINDGLSLGEADGCCVGDCVFLSNDIDDIFVVWVYCHGLSFYIVAFIPPKVIYHIWQKVSTSYAWN